MGNLTASVCVTYKFVDDWHVFQSDDIQGLYVAHKDAKQAYDDVKISIEKLIFLNEGLNCSVFPALSCEEFFSSLRSKSSSNRDEESSLIMSSKRYTVYPVAA